MSSVQDWLHTAVDTGKTVVETGKHAVETGRHAVETGRKAAKVGGKRLKKAQKSLNKAQKTAVKRGHQTQVWAQDYADHIGEPQTWAPLAIAGAVGFAVGMGALAARKVAMQATTAIAGDWFATLKAEHKLVEKLFDAVNATEESDTDKREALRAKIAYALTKHALEEETVVYPALRNADQEMAAKHLAAEHFDIKTYLHDLAETPGDDPRWMATMRELQTLVKAHVAEEEQTIYPTFHARMTKEQNAHLTTAMNHEGLKLA